MSETAARFLIVAVVRDRREHESRSMRDSGAGSRQVNRLVRPPGRAPRSGLHERPHADGPGALNDNGVATTTASQPGSEEPSIFRVSPHAASSRAVARRRPLAATGVTDAGLLADAASRPSRSSRLMKNANLGNRERAGVGIEAPLDADSE